MNLKQILDFVKVEHTLFSLPFILIGYTLAWDQFAMLEGKSYFSFDLILILFAAVGARGLAMTLNRIIDRKIDAANPRTEGRHLASGKMSLSTAWKLAGVFLSMLLISAGLLNEVALMMAWLPVLAFLIYPYMKRFTWGCHFWLGVCLGLAPAGAWVAIAADTLGWAAITGLHDGFTKLLWYPEILFLSLGVLFWITAFDLQYAKMDVESDREQGIHSFPAKFGLKITNSVTILLTCLWFGLFISTGLSDYGVEGIRYTRGTKFPYWTIATTLAFLMNIGVLGLSLGEMDSEKMGRFQKWWFRVSAATGWLLYFSLWIFEKSHWGEFD